MRLAQHIETHIHTGDAADTVTLDYEARFLRRKRLVSDGGEPFLVELAETQSLNQGEGFRLDDGRIIAVMAAAEPLPPSPIGPEAPSASDSSSAMLTRSRVPATRSKRKMSGQLPGLNGNTPHARPLGQSNRH